jgi:hypothetical protein
MRRLSTLLVVIAATAIAVPAAFAASAHWVTGPTVTTTATSLTVSGKAAGLGNTTQTADFALTGTVSVSSRCYTKSGNKPQAANKQENISVNQSGSFDIKNGTVSPTFTVTPLSTLRCPGGQTVVVESLSYSLDLTSISFPSLDTHLTA